MAASAPVASDQPSKALRPSEQPSLMLASLLSWRHYPGSRPSPSRAQRPAERTAPRTTGTSPSTTGTPFDPGTLQSKGWPRQVFDADAWGGEVMNGGSRLTTGRHRVDVHHRDLDNVEYSTKQARQDRFRKECLLFYAVGIPTYIVMAELKIVMNELSASLSRVVPINTPERTRSGSPEPATATISGGTTHLATDEG